MRPTLLIGMVALMAFGGCGEPTATESTAVGQRSPEEVAPVAGSGPLDIGVKSQVGEVCVTIRQGPGVTEDLTGCVGATKSVSAIIAGPLAEMTADADQVTVVALPAGSMNVDVPNADNRWWVVHADETAVIVVLYPVRPDEIGAAVVDLRLDGKSYSCSERTLPSKYSCATIE